MDDITSQSGAQRSTRVLLWPLLTLLILGLSGGCSKGSEKAAPTTTTTTIATSTTKPPPANWCKGLDDYHALRVQMSANKATYGDIGASAILISQSWHDASLEGNDSAYQLASEDMEKVRFVANDPTSIMQADVDQRLGEAFDKVDLDLTNLPKC